MDQHNGLRVEGTKSNDMDILNNIVFFTKRRKGKNDILCSLSNFDLENRNLNESERKPNVKQSQKRNTAAT